FECPLPAEDCPRNARSRLRRFPIQPHEQRPPRLLACLAGRPSAVPPLSLHNQGCAGAFRHERQHEKTPEISKDSGVFRSPCVGRKSPLSKLLIRRFRVRIAAGVMTSLVTNRNQLLMFAI